MDETTVRVTIEYGGEKRVIEGDAVFGCVVNKDMTYDKFFGGEASPMCIAMAYMGVGDYLTDAVNGDRH